jgi:hypothetical protein
MSDFQSDASKFGRRYEDTVAEWLEGHGMTVTTRRHRHESGVEFDLFVKSWDGTEYGVECKGSPTTATQPAMVRSDNRWKVFGYLYLLNKWRERTGQSVRYLLVTSAMPAVGTDQRHHLDDAELLGHIQIIEVPAPSEET